jgi:predicted hydrocarbon binding protein
MTWREFADAAGAKVLVRGLARGSSKKIPTKIMNALQFRIVRSMAGAGRKAMARDALKEIGRALGKNGPHVTAKLMAKDAKKAKVSKRLRKQVEAVMVHRAAKAA